MELRITQAEVDAELSRYPEEEPYDARRDHRKMLADCKARNWRVLRMIADGYGKRTIAKMGGWHVSTVQRAYAFLKKEGYLRHEMDSGMVHLVPTEKGVEKMKEMGESIDRPRVLREGDGKRGHGVAGGDGRGRGGSGTDANGNEVRFHARRDNGIYVGGTE